MSRALDIRGRNAGRTQESEAINLDFCHYEKVGESKIKCGKEKRLDYPHTNKPLSNRKKVNENKLQQEKHKRKRLTNKSMSKYKMERATNVNVYLKRILFLNKSVGINF